MVYTLVSGKRNPIKEATVTNRSFGVEIETCCSTPHNTPACWEIENEHCGLEYVSPILSGQKGLEAIRTLYASVEPQVDRHCGLHVHVDVRDFTGPEKVELVRRLKADKHLFTSKVDRDRLSNCFCDGELPDVYDNDSWGAVVNRVRGDRFVWCNILAVRKHGTIEFRLHEATEDADKVVKWVEFLTSYVENVRSGAAVTECPACVDQSFVNSQVDRLVSNLWSD